MWTKGVCLSAELKIKVVQQLMPICYCTASQPSQSVTPLAAFSLWLSARGPVLLYEEYMRQTGLGYQVPGKLKTKIIPTIAPSLQVQPKKMKLGEWAGVSVCAELFAERSLTASGNKAPLRLVAH